MTAIADMEFDGQVLRWRGTGKFRATTGLPEYQHPTHQCVKDKGPVPEGLYKVFIADRGIAKDDGTGFCNLAPAWGVQTIPRGRDAGACDPYWANWGNQRVRIEPADAITQKACRPARGGFYIHDSSKGYSHGCIEIDRGFFVSLRARSAVNRTGYLTLRVKYVLGRPTNGGTRS